MLEIQSVGFWEGGHVIAQSVYRGGRNKGQDCSEEKHNEMRAKLVNLIFNVQTLWMLVTVTEICLYHQHKYQFGLL